MTNNDTQRWIRKVTGGQPVEFHGARLCRVQPPSARRPRLQRWYQIEVFQTHAGRYVVSIVYNTKAQAEERRYTIDLCDSLTDVAAALDEYDPTAHLLGYPPDEPDRESKQTMLETGMKQRYDNAKTKAMESLGITYRVD